MFFMKRPVTEICHTIANYLIHRFKFRTITGKKNKEIYVYDEGIFKERGKEIIERECESIMENFSKNSIVNEVISKIERSTIVDKSSMGCKNVNLICLKNGVLDLEKEQLCPHSPDFGFMSKYPLVYNPTKKCDKVFRFLEDVLYHEDLKVVQEWFGFLLWRDYFAKKAVICRGEKHTGKTTFLNLMKEFVGGENISQVDLQKLAQGRWFAGELRYKFANIKDELSEKDVEDVEIFKSATGKSPLRGEKKFGDEYHFTNYAKLIFATNKVPYIKTSEFDKAYFDRWIIMTFDNIFDEKNKTTDPDILKKICTDDELSGLLNWAIIGLKRLRKQRFFSYHKTPEEIRVIMQSDSSSIARFTFECCKKVVGNWVSKEDMYEDYCRYVDINDLRRETKDMFGKRFLDFCLYCSDSRDSTGKRLGWRDVKVEDIKIFGV